MFSYEGAREHLQSSAIRTMPTAPMLQVDFSQLVTSQRQPVAIYDPPTTRQQPDGTYVRTPFAGNSIPASQINPIAAKLSTYYPQPNVTGEIGRASCRERV